MKFIIVLLFVVMQCGLFSAQQILTKEKAAQYQAKRDYKPYNGFVEGVKPVTVFPGSHKQYGEDIAASFQPTFTVAPNGDLLAFSQGRIGTDGDRTPKVLQMSISKDNGKTWGDIQSLGLPKGNMFTINCFTDLTTKTIHVLYKTDRGIHRIKSKDNGVTWTQIDSEKLNKQFGFRQKVRDDKLVRSVMLYGQAIQLKHGMKAGRWVIMGLQKYRGKEIKSQKNKSASYEVLYDPVAFYSDDHGESWSYGTGVTDYKTANIREPAVVELSNGDLMFISRRAATIEPRKFSISKDQGLTWSVPQFTKGLPAPRCLGSVTAIKVKGQSKPVLFYASAASTKRRNGHVYYSLDDGKSWNKRQIDKELFSYNTIRPLANGNLGLIYCKGWHGSRDTMFVELEPNWVMGIEEKADLTEKSNANVKVVIAILLIGIFGFLLIKTRTKHTKQL